MDQTDAYDYALPPELIADTPAAQRTGSRLLEVGRFDCVDRPFAEIEVLLRPGDLLVVNDAKVTPVRLFGERPTGGRVEVFVVGFGAAGWWEDPERPWRAMLKSNRRVAEGEVLQIGEDRFSLVERHDDGTVSLDPLDGATAALFEDRGEVPLPPYIVRRRKERGAAETNAEDAARYQTVFARQPGAVAAPTAGLHFDTPLLERLQANGVRRAAVTLLVGAGTFKPVSTESLDGHVMHSERYHVPEATQEAIAETRARGGRVVAVGTTVVRTLEAAAGAEGVTPGWAETALFIRPGYQFRVVDALITNFHLPRSTLLALVSAFAGYRRVMAAYAHAVEARYRFYSYGDAMWLTRAETQEPGA